MMTAFQLLLMVLSVPGSALLVVLIAWLVIRHQEKTKQEIHHKEEQEQLENEARVKRSKRQIKRAAI
jgi:hypothetical protein